MIPRWIKQCLTLIGLIALIVVGIVTAAPSAQAAAPGANTLDLLHHVTWPPRDPVNLASRLLGINYVPSTPTTPHSYHIGDVVQFTADAGLSSAILTLHEQLWYITPHVYVWFEVGYKPDMSVVQPSIDRFESRIYPTVHHYFGTEREPGIDNDVHLYIVHAHGFDSEIAAFYDSASEYPKVVIPSSNEHHMFFVNLDTLQNQIGTPYYEGILAHEFQHMVHHTVHPNEEGWMDEGMSKLSESLNGYLDVGDTPNFLALPTTQLNTWSLDSSMIAHYGAAYSFMTYFFQRYTEAGLKALMLDRQNGLENVRQALKVVNAVDPQTGKPVTLEDFFADWVMTNLLNNAKVGDSRYVYSRFTSPLDVPRMFTADPSGVSIPMTTSQWGTVYLKIDKPGTYQFSFQGQSTVNAVPTSAHSGQMAWWSNRDDRLDTRLTHAFDLTNVSHATLSFWTWYALEQGWDFSYVEASTDGGKTWKVLPSHDTIPVGEHNLYGPAYTGHSGGGAQPSRATWRQENVDLTPYAGKHILLRFEMITDDAYNEPGMMVDDISIPELNYSTDAETDDGGWQSEGWIRMDNVLPQSYVIQMAEYGPTPRVFRLLGPTDGPTGHWTLTVGGDVSQLVIAISGLTEFTTEPAPFQYTLTRN